MLRSVWAKIATDYIGADDEIGADDDEIESDVVGRGQVRSGKVLRGRLRRHTQNHTRSDTHSATRIGTHNQSTSQDVMQIQSIDNRVT